MFIEWKFLHGCNFPCLGGCNPKNIWLVDNWKLSILKEAKQGLEILFIVDPIDEYASRDSCKRFWVSYVSFLSWFESYVLRTGLHSNMHIHTWRILFWEPSRGLRIGFFGEIPRSYRWKQSYKIFLGSLVHVYVFCHNLTYGNNFMFICVCVVQ